MSTANPSVLYIAYHYPPIVGSSGVHRSLAFTRHLDSNGWRVRVLSASVKAYHNWSEEQFSFIPESVVVIRAFARDVSRHFSWRGKYIEHMALPDNWQSWIVGGVISGLISIVRDRPDVIVSTYPIASAHIIAYVLHVMTGVPWISDFRDPMAQLNYPADPKRKKIFEWIERKIVQHCSSAIVTAPGAKVLYQERFPYVDNDFWQVIPNGFDEKMFEKVIKSKAGSHESEDDSGPYVVLHSGVIYPYERDPSHLFLALSELKREARDKVQNLQFRLRATGNDELYQAKLQDLNITDIVKIVPAISYIPALEEMLNVDGLLLLQADNCNYQIPAKAYEYIRAGKPILALTPADGDTGKLLARTAVAEIAPLDDKEQIKTTILRFIEKLDSSEFVPMNEASTSQYSRQYQAVRFQELLENTIS